MNREESRKLKIPCDKNTAWIKVTKAVGLWSDCIDSTKVGESQIKTFRDLLIGFLIVEHDKGKPVKLFKELSCNNTGSEYSVLRKAMDFSGISSNNFNSRIKRITMYPDGDLKVEYSTKEVEWM